MCQSSYYSVLVLLCFMCPLNSSDVSTGKYKVLEKLVNTTKLPALVEQKHVQQQTGDEHEVEEFEPLTLTYRFDQTFLVVNYINDGKSSAQYIQDF